MARAERSARPSTYHRRTVAEPSNAAADITPPRGPSAKKLSRQARKARARKHSGRRLFAFDREIGSRWVAGADEAGRGSLAGPIVGAAVLFDLERLTLGDRRALSRLNDSKQHTEESREALFPLVLRAAARTAIVERSVRAIDGRGLHVSNLDALRSALLAVSCPGTICLVDGFNVPAMEHEQRAVIDGDCRSAAIAAASVLAKVSRDRYMRRIHEQHPEWDFATNVGYSTPEHRAAIAEHGVSPLHRMSFASIAYNQLKLA